MKKSSIVMILAFIIIVILLIIKILKWPLIIAGLAILGYLGYSYLKKKTN